MSNRSKTRLYYAAAVCLILVTAALRFYNLTGHFLSYDEAVAANNSRGSIQIVLENTRSKNSAPILYPIVLYAAQNVESSHLSVRIVPAAASVLTVAALLLLLPRVGISRWAAFIAALLAVGSVEAIRHAQEVREYSVDALVAALMIVGLLSYIQEKHRHGWAYVLFCASLFVAPLVQYGLVLFGIAVLGTIAVMEGKTFWSHRSTLLDGLRFPAGWVWNRLAYLIGPAASFAVGSVTSYAVTLRHQWNPDIFGIGGSFYRDHYYTGKRSDVGSLIEFALDETWEMLTFHVLELLAIAGLIALGIYFVVSIRKRRLDAIMVLFFLVIAIGIGGAVMRVYPYGGIRQCMYLAPIIFVAFGYALHSVVIDASSFTRKAWMAHAGMSLAAGVIVLSAAAAIGDSSLYRKSDDMEFVLLILEDLMSEGDIVYTGPAASPLVEFYQKGKRDDYCYSLWPKETFETCTESLFRQQPDTERMWLIIGGTARSLIDRLSTERNQLDLVGDRRAYDLYLWTDPFLGDPSLEELDAIRYAQNRAPAVQSVYDVHVRERTLIYIKEPCVRSDAAARFFLHVTPTDIEDLQEGRKQHGFENLDFDLIMHGIVTDEKCIAIRGLPEYGIERISTGQTTIEKGQIEDGQIWKQIWKSEFALEE